MTDEIDTPLTEEEAARQSRHARTPAISLLQPAHAPESAKVEAAIARLAFANKDPNVIIKNEDIQTLLAHVAAQAEALAQRSADGGEADALLAEAAALFDVTSASTTIRPRPPPPRNRTEAMSEPIKIAWYVPAAAWLTTAVAWAWGVLFGWSA